MLIICGLPTVTKETTLAVSSWDFRLDPLDPGGLSPSEPISGEDSKSTSESRSSS